MPHQGYPERAEYQASLIRQESDFLPFTFIRMITQDSLTGEPEYGFIGNVCPTYGPATEAQTLSGEAQATQQYEGTLFAGAIAIGLYHQNVCPQGDPYAKIAI